MCSTCVNVLNFLPLLDQIYSRLDQKYIVIVLFLNELLIVCATKNTHSVLLLMNLGLWSITICRRSALQLVIGKNQLFFNLALSGGQFLQFLLLGPVSASVSVSISAVAAICVIFGQLELKKSWLGISKSFPVFFVNQNLHSSHSDCFVPVAGSDTFSYTYDH